MKEFRHVKSFPAHFPDLLKGDQASVDRVMKHDGEDQARHCRSAKVL